MKHSHRFVAAGVIAVLLSGTGLASAQAGGPLGPNNQPETSRTLRQTKVIYPTVSEQDFVAVTPCRIVDTRKAGGKMAPGQTRSYYVGGTTQFVNQGGKSGGCGIPVGATSVSAILTAVDSSGSGFMRAFPANKSEPSATVLNYSGTADTGTGATVSINPAAAQSLKVKNYGSNTHLVVDVTGYTIPPITVVISAGGGAYSGTTRVLSVTQVGTGSYDVVVDRSTVGCVPQVTMHGGNYYASAYEHETNKVRVNTWALNATAQAVPTNLFVSMTLGC